MRKITNFQCLMRDRVRLFADLYLPEPEGRYPLILLRTPYGKEKTAQDDPLYKRYPDFVEAGFIVVFQDCRGTGYSGGTINLNGANEQNDGYDSVEFFATQSFCDGNIGMFGLSYFGFTQIAAAAKAPKHLKAISPFMCCSLTSFGTSIMQTVSCAHLGWAYGQLLDHAEHYLPDKAFRDKILPILRENQKKMNQYNLILPMNQNPAAIMEGIPMLQDYLDLLEGVEKKEFWDSINSPISYDSIHTAMLCGTGWMDGFCNSAIENYIAARHSTDTYTRENAYLLIGPWTHGGQLPSRFENMDFGEENSGEAQNVFGILLQWFQHYLKKEKDVPFQSRVRYFVLNDNNWRTAADWPPPEAIPVKYYLAAGAALQTDLPNAGEAFLTYDPMNPAPSMITDEKGRTAFADWSEISGREDVLEFASDSLSADILLAGCVQANFYAATDVPDTDFVCRLMDVSPDGYKRQITVGFVRARHRNGLFKNDFLISGETVLFEFGIGNTAYSIPAGHRIGIQLTGSMFPGINRNLNTIEPPSLGSSWEIAHDRIFFGGAQASNIVLPVIKK